MNQAIRKLQKAALVALLFSAAKAAAQDPHATLPTAPTWAGSSIDERGKIRLAWQAAAAEKDVIGYWVGFANSKKDEFALVHGRRLTEPFFDWNLKEKSLNDAAHFVVVAEDVRHNRSRPSAILTLKRPDRSAPLAPFLNGVSQKGDELAISWKTSASADAQKQVLFRRNLSEAQPKWEVLDTLDARIELFSDEKSILESWYEYRLAAFDEAGNWSAFSNTAKGQRRFRPEAAKVKNFAAVQPNDGEGLRVELAWQFEPPSAENAPQKAVLFSVYRAVGNGRLGLVAQTKEAKWADFSVERGALYSYAVRAHFGESHLGELSAAKAILVK